MNEPIYLEWWYEALAHPIGYVITFSQGNVTTIRNKLYEARKRAGDPRLSALSVCLHANLPQTIFIVHKEVQLGATDEA